MKAWSAAEPTTSDSVSTIAGAVEPQRSEIVPESEPSQPVAMGGPLQQQLAREVASLILHRQQEVWA